MHTSQTEGGGENSVWSRRVTALSLETRLKKMFVVFSSVLIVSSIASGMGIMEHGQVQVGQSTLNLSLQEGNNTWRNISLPDQSWNETSPPSPLMYD